MTLLIYYVPVKMYPSTRTTSHRKWYAIVWFVARDNAIVYTPNDCGYNRIMETDHDSIAAGVLATCIIIYNNTIILMRTIVIVALYSQWTLDGFGDWNKHAMHYNNNNTTTTTTTRWSSEKIPGLLDARLGRWRSGVSAVDVRRHRPQPRQGYHTYTSYHLHQQHRHHHHGNR